MESHGVRPDCARAHHAIPYVAQATDLPVILYSDPPAYRVNVTPGVRQTLSDTPNIVVIAEPARPAPLHRRDQHLQRSHKLHAGLDDLSFEGLLARRDFMRIEFDECFPGESIELVQAIGRGGLNRARAIYRWFIPLLT